MNHRRAVQLCVLGQLVEGLAGDAVLGTEGRDRTTWGVVGLLSDGEADARDDGVEAAIAEASRFPQAASVVVHGVTRRCPPS